MMSGDIAPWILSLVLAGDKWSTSRPGHLVLGKRRLFERFGEGKILCRQRELNPDLSIVNLQAWSLSRLNHLGYTVLS
jgi:hypothetical protein